MLSRSGAGGTVVSACSAGFHPQHLVLLLDDMGSPPSFITVTYFSSSLL
jgi:hypothetical protein